MKYKILLFWLFLSHLTAFAQKPDGKRRQVGLADAITIALANNPQLKAAGLSVKIAQNNANPAMAGFYPRLSASANGGYNLQDTRLEFAASNMEAIEVQSAESFVYGGGLSLNYTLFDGLGNWYTLRQRKSEWALSQIEFETQLENTIVNVSNRYFEMARWQEQWAIEQENIAISLDRFQRAQLRSALGNSSGLELSSAAVDLRNDSLNLLNAHTQFFNARRNLNALLGENDPGDYLVETAVAFELLPNDSTLLFNALNQNNSLKSAQMATQSQAYLVQATKSDIWPQLDFSTGYNYNVQENEVGLLLFNRTNGLTAGLNLRWDLFSGWVNQIRIQNAKLSLKSAQNQLQQAQYNLEAGFGNALQNHKNALQSAGIAQRNIKLAQLNFDRANELFKLGQLNRLEFREAQINLSRAENQLAQSHFAAKLAEIELKRVCGMLAKPQTAE